MKSLVGSVEVTGTLICVGGTLVISLYKGKVLHLWPTNIIGYHPNQAGPAFGHHHTRGTILLVISCLSLAVWYTVQVHAAAPAHLVTYINVLVQAVISLFVAFGFIGLRISSCCQTSRKIYV
jgi:hypothetical protein